MSSSSGISSSSLSNSSVYHRDRMTSKMLDEILEEDNYCDDIAEASSVSCMDNIEDVKRINGKSISNTKDQEESKDLILHLVGANSLVKFGGNQPCRG